MTYASSNKIPRRRPLTLTPIKVKGRGRKPKWQPPNPAQLRSLMEERRRKREEENGHDNVDGISSRSSKRSKQSFPPKSRLESLPPEMLWPIAVRSQNLHLLRVSKFLRGLLSDRSFELEMAVAAFGPTWDMYFGRPRSTIGSPPEPEQFPGDPKFQGNVLVARLMHDTRYMNVDFILKAQQVWCRQERTERHMEKAACILWKPPTQVQPKQEGSEANEDQRAEEKQELGYREREVEKIRERFDEDWQEFCDACPFNNTTKLEYEIGTNTQGPEGGYLDLHPLTPIPDRFLKGPFDLESVKLLFWLVRGGARILPEHNWEATKHGFEQIMNMESRLGIYVLILFDILGVFKKEHWPPFLLDEKMKWVKETRRIEMSAQSWKYRLSILAHRMFLSRQEQEENSRLGRDSLNSERRDRGPRR
ncbi:hypothetical protein QC762_119770 [Podospora pseudocomata]|uniref:F-box domain-containing protein n=1 Tax=Podospora pseudocomata TaxID=2093779 RepID=A0ABR0GXN3_9PEZI|nr:hypothetical protein QC762_119770 [Podospora pseudocomata]